VNKCGRGPQKKKTWAEIETICPRLFPKILFLLPTIWKKDQNSEFSSDILRLRINLAVKKEKVP